MTKTDSPTQSDFWNGEAGKRWVSQQPMLDRALAPYGEALLATAQVHPGERVLEVGCGAGATTVELAARVGPQGSVLAVDVSAPLLEAARARCAQLGNVSTHLGDAAELEPRGHFDLLCSRFGVMFFEQPAQAFARLHAQLAPGGRLAFVCWQSVEHNAWATEPLKVLRDVLPTPAPSAPNAPGPFSLGDTAYRHGLLEGAGFVRVHSEPLVRPMLLGATEDEAATYLLTTGLLTRALREAGADEALLARCRTVLHTLARGWKSDAGVLAPAATWLVTASRGPAV